MPSKGIQLRLFLSCWVLFSLHFATDFVREHYLVVSMVENGSYDLGRFYPGYHEDIFQNARRTPRQGVHHGANPGISMIAAIPYFFAKPVVDRIVAREIAGRHARGDTTAIYRDDRVARVKFYELVRKSGLDIRFGLVGIITMVFCMAPLSALGAVTIYRMLTWVGFDDRRAVGLSALYVVGTPVLMRTGYLNHNMAVGVFGILAFALLWNARGDITLKPTTRYALAGFLGGLALLCDYSGALLLGILGLYGLWRALDDEQTAGAIRLGACYGLGAVLPILLLWQYQWASFGHPFYPPQHWMPPQIYSDAGYQGITGLQPGLLASLMVDPRYGLLVASPLAILALAAPWLSWRNRSVLPRREMVVCFAVTLAFVLFFSTVAYVRLQWITGIRYLVPVIPFVFVLSVVTLVRLPRPVAYGFILLAITVGWSMAMVRSQRGVHVSITRVFIEGFQLPWLTTLGKMSAQYATWLQGLPSPLPAMALAAAVILGIWSLPSLSFRSAAND